MAAQANITVFDGAATPVSHTLVALGVENQKDGSLVALWGERNAALPLEANVRASVKRTTLPSGILRFETTVEVPVMEAISGQNAAGYTAAPKVAYVDKFQTVQFRHPRSTTTTSRLARQILTNLLNNVSTSVAAATTGPLPDMYDNAIMPS